MAVICFLKKYLHFFGWFVLGVLFSNNQFKNYRNRATSGMRQTNKYQRRLRYSRVSGYIISKHMFVWENRNKETIIILKNIV